MAANRWRLSIDGRYWGVTGGQLGDVKAAIERAYPTKAVDIERLPSAFSETAPAPEKWLYRFGGWFDGLAPDIGAQLDQAMERHPDR